MSLDHEAIYKAYPNAITVDDGTGAKDKDGKSISIDDTLVKKARLELDEEYVKVKYKDDRKPLYPSLEDFADAMYWNSKGDSTKLEAYYTACEKVKTDNPKPN